MKKATSLAKSLNAINDQLELLRKKKIQAVLRPLHRERKKLLSRLEKLDRTIGSALGEKNGASQLAMKTIARGRKRIRRSGNELKKIAGGRGRIYQVKRNGRGDAWRNQGGLRQAASKPASIREEARRRATETKGPGEAAEVLSRVKIQSTNRCESQRELWR